MLFFQTNVLINQ